MNLFALETVVMTRQVPHLRDQLLRGAEAGELRRVLPGVYVLADMAERFDVRALAACRRFPSAVLCGETAALLTYAPTRPQPAVVDVAHKGAPHKGFRFSRQDVPPEYVGTAGGLRFTLPPWTVLELALAQGPGAIDEALRLGVKLDHLAASLRDHAPRRGTSRLRGWLDDSREHPWSPAERQGHLALREAGITGWRGNLEVRTPTRRAFLDVGFEHLLLGIEIDGYEHHSSQRAHVMDKLRDADLAALGWQIQRLPASLVMDAPTHFAELVSRIVAQREALFNWTSGR